MEFRIMDSNFYDRVLLDRYESLLWVDRYNEPGDFELYTPPTDTLLEFCKIGNYIYSRDSEHLMIIEHVELSQSYDEGARMIIKGRSIESILERRILWYKTKFKDNLEDGIRQILDFSIIDPPSSITDPNTGEVIETPEFADRKIDNFRFEYSNNTVINHAAVNCEFEIGTDLLTVVQGLCKSVNVGFKIILNDQNQFVFKLFAGVNRSYSQTKLPWVVFSKRFENLITNSFVSDSTDYKNTVRTVAVTDEDGTQDFISYESQRMNLLDPQGGVYQINDDAIDFIFETDYGKLEIDTTYSFTSRVAILSGNITEITVELTSDDPYSRIYASADIPVTQIAEEDDVKYGRITAILKPEIVTAGFNDCCILRVYAGKKGETTDKVVDLYYPIFSVSDTEFKAVGLNRYEYYNDASDVDITDEMKSDWDNTGKAQYEALLQESAYQALDAHIVKTQVDGSVEDKVSYEYGKDYYIGDIVQVENEFGILGTMRVTEFVTSHSTSGIEMYPTFSSTTEGEGV